MDVLVCMYAFFSTFLLFQCNFAATVAQSHSRLLRRNSRPSHGGIKARLMQLQLLGVSRENHGLVYKQVR